MRGLVGRSTCCPRGRRAVGLVNQRRYVFDTAGRTAKREVAARREPVLDAIVRRACRAIRFVEPGDAGQILIALAALSTPLPVRPTTLLVWIAPQLCEYALADLTLTFEALSALRISHHLVTAHLLKLILRSTCRQLTPPPTHALPPLFPLVSRLCDTVLTLRRWHTPRTVRSFVIALERTAPRSALARFLEVDQRAALHAQRGITLFLFEVYVQCGLIPCAEFSDAMPRSTERVCLFDELPFLCATLHSALWVLTPSDTERALHVLQGASGVPLAIRSARVDVAIGTEADTAREQLRALLSPRPRRHGHRGVECRATPEPPLPPFADAASTNTALREYCARLHSACRRVPRDVSFARHHLLPLLRASHAVLVRDAAFWSHYAGSNCHRPDEQFPYAVDINEDCSPDAVDSDTDAESASLLRDVLTAANEVCAIGCDGHSDAEVRAVLHDTVSLWLEAAVSSLLCRLAVFKAAVSHGGETLSWDHCGANRRASAVTGTWDVALSAVELCNRLSPFLTSGAVASSTAWAKTTKTLSQQVCAVLQWLFATLRVLKDQTEGKEKAIIGSPSQITWYSVRTHVVTNVLALLYLSTDGALIVPGCADAELQAEIRSGCCAVLPFTVESIEAFLSPPPPMSLTRVLGVGAACGDNLQRSYSLSALAATMRYSFVLRAHVVAHLFLLPHLLSPIMAFAMEADGARHVPSSEQVMGARWHAMLVSLLVAHNPPLSGAVRSAAHVWARLLSTCTLSAVRRITVASPHVVDPALLFTPERSVTVPLDPPHTGAVLAAEALHRPLEEGLTEMMTRSATLRADAQGTLCTHTLDSKHTSAVHALPKWHAHPFAAPAARDEKRVSQPGTVAFRFPSFRLFAETERLLFYAVRAIVSHVPGQCDCAHLEADASLPGVALLYMRLLCWMGGLAHATLLSAHDERSATSLFSHRDVSHCVTELIAHVLGLIVSRRATLTDVLAYLELSDDASSDATSVATRATNSGCVNECRLLRTWIDVAVLPAYVLHMMHLRSTTGAAPLRRALNSGDFPRFLARLVQLPRRHRSLITSLLQEIEDAAPTCVRPSLSAWCKETRALWSPAMRSISSALTLPQLVVFVIRSTNELSGAHDDENDQPHILLAPGDAVPRSLLLAFLTMVERGFPLLHVLHNGHFRYLSDDALVHLVQSTVGLLILLDAVVLVDPLLVSAQLTPEATAVRAVLEQLKDVHDTLAQLHYPHALCPFPDIEGASRQRSPPGVGSLAAKQTVFLRVLCAHTARAIARMLSNDSSGVAA